jgi:hypothetical protein
MPALNSRQDFKCSDPLGKVSCSERTASGNEIISQQSGTHVGQSSYSTHVDIDGRWRENFFKLQWRWSKVIKGLAAKEIVRDVNTMPGKFRRSIVDNSYTIMDGLKEHNVVVALNEYDPILLCS